MNTKISTAARLILGLLFLVFGLNGFLNFLPISPPPMSDNATAFFTGLMKSGYFFPVLKATETLSGLLLLTGFAAPLALIILAPITIQIVLFHANLTPELKELVLPTFILILHVTAASRYWKIYRPLFSRA